MIKGCTWDRWEREIRLRLNSLRRASKAGRSTANSRQCRRLVPSTVEGITDILSMGRNTEITIVDRNGEERERGEIVADHDRAERGPQYANQDYLRDLPTAYLNPADQGSTNDEGRDDLHDPDNQTEDEDFDGEDDDDSPADLDSLSQSIHRLRDIYEAMDLESRRSSSACHQLAAQLRAQREAQAREIQGLRDEIARYDEANRHEEAAPDQINTASTASSQPDLEPRPPKRRSIVVSPHTRFSQIRGHSHERSLERQPTPPTNSTDGS
ncbi:hypothetical protein M409DRAFT_59438 [Zasmidium cellare ATCC 36951]|uniref:Uncharacterized protein n=1 Tax=Zasmidium cellare ATCC 36951 TaxID=1080233 RepID=A0A6A6C261_ZASCE|nr:uncharacterized protein M409DRAFT_59438 [Zasmidium cellare ATCC 36951]KAF2161187.1 hypothetical protein M409DRAFT_59438 [Zasmidium cellare ATCC 36951]